MRELKGRTIQAARKELRIMYVTAMQPIVVVIRQETAALRQPQQTVPRRDATSLSAAFAEHPSARRLDEWAAALDFPLDFQI
jgi:hypothetical protein